MPQMDPESNIDLKICTSNIKIWLNNAVFRSKHALRESNWQESISPYIQYRACTMACINNHTDKNEDGYVPPSVSILWPDC